MTKVQGRAYGRQRHSDGFCKNRLRAGTSCSACVHRWGLDGLDGLPPAALLVPGCTAAPSRARANRFSMRPKGRTASAPASCRPQLYEPICPSCARGRGASTPADPTVAWGASTLGASWVRRLPLMHCLAWGPVSRSGREACASLRVLYALGRCAAHPHADACSTGLAGVMPSHSICSRGKPFGLSPPLVLGAINAAEPVRTQARDAKKPGQQRPGKKRGKRIHEASVHLGCGPH